MTIEEIRTGIEKINIGISNSRLSESLREELRKKKQEFQTELEKLETVQKEERQAISAPEKKEAKAKVKEVKSTVEKKTKKLSEQVEDILSKIRNKKVVSFNKGRSAGSLERDSKKPALHPGKRISADGNVYYENRPDHSDISSKRPFLEDGGEMYGRGGAFGGNSGYVGYSMSKRAANAYEDGKLTYSKLPTWAKRMVDSGMATTDEWHHTSSYGNQTPFYNVQQFFDHLTDEEREKYDVENIESFKDVPKQLIKDIDEKAKVQLKKKNSIKEVRKGFVDAALKELNDFNSKFKWYIREKNSPKYGINKSTEMNGKFGWFDSSRGYYNLPEYYTGINYETEENMKKSFELQSNLDAAQRKPIYRVELLKRGFTDN